MEQSLKQQALVQLEANQLSELTLSSKKLTAKQVIRLAKALKVNRTLTKLDLSYSKLDAVGMESLSAALKVNQTLTTLYLDGTQFGVAGAESLSEALKVNQTLRTLDLSFNKFDVTAVKSLSTALKMNKTLTTLVLDGNHLDDAIVQGIQAALQSNIERIKHTRQQTLLALMILLRQAQSPQSQLPFEIWTIILQQLDFPSIKRGYRTSYALASFLTQKNIFTEINQRWQTKHSVCLVETHGTKLGESRFSFLVPQTPSVSGVTNTMSRQATPRC